MSKKIVVPSATGRKGIPPGMPSGKQPKKGIIGRLIDLATTGKKQPKKGK